MLPTSPDIFDLSGEDIFTFPGNYRAIVEDNEDPIDIGRVRVRILGIHSLDPKETPTEHLPWAEPALPLYHSGGQNLDCRDQPDQKRYTPDGTTFDPQPRNTKVKQITEVDKVQKKEGTGGIFTVPKKGSMVWVFFENGDHTRPQYWACAPKKDDWEKQRKKLIDEIKIKQDNINYWRKKFESILDAKEYRGKDSITVNAKVKTGINVPKLEILNVKDIENYHITSFTSPGGVTSIIVNLRGKEKMYIIHKGMIEYIDHQGQRKIMVGNTNFKNDGNPGVSNDFEHLVANNYELHIGGDFDIFVRKSKYVQIDGDMEINVKHQVGLVTREGNISIIVNNGDCYLDAKNVNIAARDNIQIHAAKNMVLRADNIISLVGKKVVMSSGQDAPGVKDPSFPFKDTTPPVDSGNVGQALSALSSPVDDYTKQTEVKDIKRLDTIPGVPTVGRDMGCFDTWLARIPDDVGIYIETSHDFHMKVDGDFVSKIKYSFNVNSGRQVSYKCTQYSIICKCAGFHIDAGSKFRVDKLGFGGDKTCNAQIVNARHPGCFPGPIAGFATPYPGTPIPPKPIFKINPVQQKEAKQTPLQEPNKPEVQEETDSGRSLPPVNIPD